MSIKFLRHALQRVSQELDYRKSPRDLWITLYSGEAWWDSDGPIVWKTKKYYAKSRTTGISYIQQKGKGTWTGHILCRNCLLKQVIEGDRGKDVMKRRGWRRKQLMDDCKENTGYWIFEGKAPDRRHYGLIVRQTTEWAFLLGQPQSWNATKRQIA